MNDQTNLPPNSLQSRPTWTGLSTALKEQLLGQRVDVIEATPALMAELEIALPAILAEATRPATRAEIVAVLSKRFAVYPQPDRNEPEWDAWFDDYTSALEDIPPSAIEAGMAEYIRGSDSEFFPKPGRLRELARTVPNRMAQIAQQARWAVQRMQVGREAERASADMRAEPTAAEKRHVQNMLKTFQREMAERSPKTTRPERPPVSGSVDSTGLTERMRDHMRGRG